MVSGTTDFRKFAEEYCGYISELLSNLDTSGVEEFVNELERARKDGNTLFFAGNGGSAATAMHMVNDLGFGTRIHVDPPFRVLSLTDNPATLTAISNDTGYDNIFIRQLQMHYRPGDTLVAVSASGNSPNLVAAAEWVKNKGGRVISLLGFDGGKLAGLSDVPIIVETPKGEYGPVEDVHMILDHLIYTWLWQRKRKEQA
ncbi:MAG: SIS domain-containing protein [Candidatus Omnitrophica bacterium]|nr:SIS domain-containing protein [Candidatus Omnitrophota bacterium]